MTDPQKRIAENVAAVEQRIGEAATRSGRSAREVTLVAVTKYVGVAEVRALVEAGHTILGESRPQQLWDKAAATDDLPVRWHMIGHLQRNKVRRTLPLVEMVHSLDTRPLAEATDRMAGELSLRVPVLLEVNISGEAAKHGFAPEELESLLAECVAYEHIEVRGLMCMASREGGVDVARREFAQLRQLRDRLQGVAPPTVRLDELSMGMSGDYEVAIEEGATIVRVGSVLFEGVMD